MEFYSRNNLPKTIAQPKCNKLVNEYAKEIQKNGAVKAVVKGKTNIYEKIQAGKEQCLVYNILERFKNGDVTALNQRQGEYGDFTNAPKTLVEAQQRLIDAENYFMSLPLDVRKEFDHNFSQFLSSVNDGSVTERHSYFKPTKEVLEAKDLAAAQQKQSEQIVHTPNIISGGTNNE